MRDARLAVIFIYTAFSGQHIFGAIFCRNRFTGIIPQNTTLTHEDIFLLKNESFILIVNFDMMDLHECLDHVLNVICTIEICALETAFTIVRNVIQLMLAQT